MSHHEHVVSLRDGTRCLVRPIRADDKDKLIEGLDRLSPESRYRRFLRPVNSLNEREVRYLTEIDYVNHFAWAAMALDLSGQPGLGVARYVRDPIDPDVAEMAVAVLDEFQGNGLGTILLSLLSETAHINGITVFRAWVLGENHQALALLDGPGTRKTADQGLLKVEIDLPDALQGSTMQAALRAAAAGQLPT